MSGKLRRFRAQYITTENGTGIGLSEHMADWDRQTIKVESLFEPNKISNRDASMIIFERIFYDLKEDEGAVLQMSRYGFAKGWDRPFRAQMNVQHITANSGRLYQVELLAKDALRNRKDSGERFAEPFAFYPVQQQIEESRG